MEAFIKLRPEELKQELLDKIKLLIQNNDNTEIIIQVRERSPNVLEESPVEYMRQLNDSISEKESGRTTTFTMEEFRQYVNDNFSE